MDIGGGDGAGGHEAALPGYPGPEAAQAIAAAALAAAAARPGALHGPELFRAAETGRVDDARAAIRRGARAGWINGIGITAMGLACANGHLAVARCLYEEHTAEVAPLFAHEVPAAALGTPFHQACENGHLEVARWLYEAVPEARGTVARATLTVRETPAYMACQLGHLDVAKWLFDAVPESRESFTQLDRFKCSPVHAASRAGRLDTVKWLCKTVEGARAQILEADINRRDSFFTACLYGQLHVAEWIYESIPAVRDSISNGRIASMTPMHAACSRGHLDVVRWLFKLCLASRAAVTQLDASGRTPFMAACQASKGGPRDRNVEACERVVEWLAQLYEAQDFLHRADSSGRTPLQVVPQRLVPWLKSCSEAAMARKAVVIAALVRRNVVTGPPSKLLRAVPLTAFADAIAMIYPDVLDPASVRVSAIS